MYGAGKLPERRQGRPSFISIYPLMEDLEGKKDILEEDMNPQILSPANS
jgi:hypothetical protein